MKILSTSLLFLAALALPVTTPVAQSQDLRTHPLLRPPIANAGQKVVSRVQPTPQAPAAAPVTATGLFRGFTGLTQRDQRYANNGNQFGTVPPDQGLAVGNGLIVEAINSALSVYDTNGVQQPHLPSSGPSYATQYPLALTQFFGLPSAFNRANTTGTPNGTCGPDDPFDPVAIFDPETQRWFVAAVAIDAKPNCTSKKSSKLYIAVSQTADPTGAYYIYTVNTTDGADPDGNGPRFLDYPKIGLDHNVVVVTGNEFTLPAENYSDAAIYVFSKSTLEAGPTGTITAAEVIRKPFVTGFEFTLLPQMAPPGTAYLTSNGGTLYLASSNAGFNTSCSLAVWALVGTSTPGTATLKGPAVVNTQCYNEPSQAVIQQDGFRILSPLETIDPGDDRMGGQNIVFTNSQLMCTLATEVTDSGGNQIMAAAWFVLHPTISGGTLAATLTTQGIIALDNQTSFLRPAIAFNTQLFGDVVGAQVGPNDFPSAAFVPFNGFTPGSVVIARAGDEPLDEFEGSPARYGDYSAAMVDSDNSIWMGTENVRDISRGSASNWNTYLLRNQQNH